MRNQAYYHSTLELLKKYSSQLNKMIEDGSFYCLPYTKRSIQIRQIKRLYNKLRGPIGDKKLISILAAASILVLGVSCPSTDNGDGNGNGDGDGKGDITFNAPVQNPFGLTNVSYIAAPAFTDLDGDGDIDLLVGEYYGNLQYFQNTGTANAPSFTAPVQNPFGLTAPVPSYYSFPAFADLDGDGDMDLMIGGVYYTDFQYYQNTGTANAPAFAAPVQNPFGLTGALYYVNIFAIADFDGDGDMDILSGEYYGNFQYFQNTGTANAPSFTAPVQNPFGLTAPVLSYFVMPAIADLDEDGDLDILAGEGVYFAPGYVANFNYYKNTGTANAPAFAAPEYEPFNLTSTLYISLPTFADLDGDGDMDLLVGEYYGNFQYYENTTDP
jgi:hypothetical protein